MTIEHVEAPPGEIHPPFNWVAATEADRLLITSDGLYSLHGLCLQTDTTPATVWRMSSVAPVAWELVGQDLTDYAKTLNPAFTGYIDLAAINNPSHSAGRIYRNTADQISIMSKYPGVVNQVGFETWIEVFNNTGVQINNGQPCYLNGMSGALPTVALADASVALTSQNTIGLATMDIASGASGVITVQGYVNGINTLGLTSGSPVYLSETTGALTSTEPASPAYVVHIGHAGVIDAINGTIYVDVDVVTQTANSVRVDSGAGIVEMNNLQDFFRHSWSSGITDGCAITNNGNGTVSIAAGEIVIRETNSDDGVLKAYVVAAQNNINLSDAEVSYLYINYNSGVPVWQVGTALSDFDGITKVIGYVVGRNGTTLNIVDVKKINVDFGRKSRRQKVEADGFIFSGWHRSTLGPSPLGNSGLSITVGAGKYYYFDNPITHAAFDTTVAGTALPNVFRRFYNRASWQQTADLKTVNNTQYDNAGTLTTLGSGRYRTDWWYVVMCGGSPYLAQIMGNAEYTTLAAAQAAPLPAALPPHFDGIGILLGQSVVLKNATTLTISKAGSSVFTGQAPINHSDTSNLTANDHPQYDLGDSPITALGTLSTTPTIALVTQSQKYTATTNGNTTIVFSGVPSAGFTRDIQLALTVTASNTVTFTGAAYDGKVAPSYSGSGKTDLLEITFNGSTPTVLISAKDVG